MRILLPESFHSYASGNDISTAVDHILSRNSRSRLEVPPDLGWDQLPKFHSAVLAAHQVRCEYATLLHELWNKVWGDALNDLQEAGPTFEPLTIAEAHDYHGETNVYDTYSVWENFECGQYVKRNGHVVWLSLQLDRSEATLWLWAGKSNGKQNVRALKAAISAKGWRREPEKVTGGLEYGRTKKGIALIQDREMKLDGLIAAAKEALTELVNHTT